MMLTILPTTALRENRLIAKSYEGHLGRFADETVQMVVPTAQEVLDNPVLAAYQSFGGAIASVVNAGDEILDTGAKIISRNKAPVEGHDLNSPFAFSGQGLEDITGRDRSVVQRGVGVYNEISHVAKDGIRALFLHPGANKNYNLAT